MHRSRIPATLVGGLAVAVALLGSSGPADAQGGTIAGEVKFSGTAPAPKVVKVNKDVEA